MFKLFKNRGLILMPALLVTLVAAPLPASAKNVLIETSLGNIEIELLEQDAPKTVANFLNYIDSGRYENSFLHRSVEGFIIQGGGFTYSDDTAFEIETFPAVENEFGLSNTRGTVAMAKLSNQPDSATSQWFINVGNNSGNLDNQNGGFTVFARVVGDGMEIVDEIDRLQRANAGGAFAALPVRNFSGGTITGDNLVMTGISEVVEAAPFVMNTGLNDAWYDPATDGQGFFITVFPDLGTVLLSWFTYDTELPPEDAVANLGDAGHRWLVAIGPVEGNRAVLEIDSPSGGLFDSPTEIEHRPDGTITLTFENCNSGVVQYDIPSIDQQGSVPIQRVANDNIELCEALKEDGETQTNQSQ